MQQSATEKVCRSCDIVKPRSDFYTWRGHLKSECKACQNKRRARAKQQRLESDPSYRDKHNAYKREYIAARPEKKALYALQSRAQNYGLSREDVGRMLEAQQGRCGLCGEHLVKYVIDHNHHTGKVRSLLCVKCNNGIGVFDEDPNKLQLAMEYLRTHNA